MASQSSTCLIDRPMRAATNERSGLNGGSAFLVEEHTPLPAYYRGSVMLLGNFDGFHKGHRALLRAARRLADEWNAPLGIFSCEPHPRQIFNKDCAPFRLTTPDTKHAAFSSAQIDFVYQPRFSRDFALITAESFVRDILVVEMAVRAVVVGSDFRFGRMRSGGVSLLRSIGCSLGFDVIEVPDELIDGVRVSSSLIRLAIQRGDISVANDALGAVWTVTAQARDGLVSFDESQILPPSGPYSVSIEDRVSGKVLPCELELLDNRCAKLMRVAFCEPRQVVVRWLPRG